MSEVSPTASRPAASDAAATIPRVVVVDADKLHDVFDVLGVTDATMRVRSPYLFEIGEQLAVRIEQNGMVTDAVARVCAHVGPDDARVTELELVSQSAPRPMVSG